ncbi:putative F-box domain-containing protein [Helianthus annuus]|nr:putative F-box domain-containing protein [Helianthus annuus]KAJ0440966.1 putative F-box domain-containing protein [Helianthus annuus]KAJ0819649.1 putative F-box domain-containing protein [Helianthus annuus]
MSAYIPFEIQGEIMKKFPVKSLIRFRSVSKQWKSLINSSEFITDHSINQTQPHHLLIKYTAYSKDRYVSIVDDDSSRHHKFSPAVPSTVKPLWHPSVLGCSHGLVSLLVRSKGLIVFWNPSIRKSVDIVLPDGNYAFVFGVCPKTIDPKIVKFSPTNEAEVFTLSSGAWRSISMNLRPPHESLRFRAGNTVVIDGVIHRINYDYEFECHHRIITYDLTSDEFEEVDLPDGLQSRKNLDISKLKESVVVLEYYYAMEQVCDIWMMRKNGVQKSSFTKLFSVNVVLHSIIGFRKNGQLILGGGGELKVYEPGSEHMNSLGIYGWHFKVASYTESLLLLNHPAVTKTT